MGAPFSANVRRMERSGGYGAGGDYAEEQEQRRLERLAEDRANRPHHPSSKRTFWVRLKCTFGFHDKHTAADAYIRIPYCRYCGKEFWN